MLGIDTDPPRRRLHRSEFHLVRPSDHDRIVELVTAFNPHVIVHLSVWEPFSRAAPARRPALTEQAATSILGAVAECRALESIVVRSGIEVYGRARGSLTRPDEWAPSPRPAVRPHRSPRSRRPPTRSAGGSASPVAAVRLGAVLGPHVPSPLGRLLRMPAVPFSVLADPPFAVAEDVECARAFVAAAERRLDEPVNVVDHGAITVAPGDPPRPPPPDSRSSAPSGTSPGWSAGCSVRRSPTTSWRRSTVGALPTTPGCATCSASPRASSTVDVIDRLYRWPSVIHVAAARPMVEQVA